MALIHIKRGDETVPVGDDAPLPVGGFQLPKFDNIVMTYNANGDIETVIYSRSGEQVAMLTLGYDAVTNALTSVTRS